MKELIHNYYQWLNNNTIIKQVNGFAEITTPFLDRHNDCIQLYIKQENNNYYICDDGYTLDDLQLSGIDISTPKRKSLLNDILTSYGINLNIDGELFVRCTQDNFPLKKHFFIQAIQDINNLCYTARSTVANLFTEDVTEFFEKYDIRALPNIQLVGKSGLPVKIDFAISRSKARPERYVQLANTINTQTTEHIIFGWEDLKDVRRSSEMIVILNDEKQKLKSDIMTAYSSYNIKPILWSHRETKNNLDLLVG